MNEQPTSPPPATNPTSPGERPEQARLLPEALLQPGESVRIETKPALAMILIACYRTVFWGVMLLVVNEWVQPDRMLFAGARLTVAAVAVGGVALRVALAVLDWLGRVYVLTDRRLIRQRGILHVNVFECPLDRIQNTYLDFTWQERLLGLGTIVFMTAGSGQAEAAWAYVWRPLELHRQIVEAVQAARLPGAAPAGPAGSPACP